MNPAEGTTAGEEKGKPSAETQTRISSTIQIKDGRVFNEKYRDIYFSAEDGMAESEFVFLQGNDLRRRFQDWHHGRAFCIGELGFGTGLNFVLASKLFTECAPSGARLHYLSFESSLPAPAECRRSISLFPSLRSHASLLRRKLRGVLQRHSGIHTLDFHRIRLTLILGDAREQIHRMQARCHAWFLDGFAPSRNPELWERSLLQEVFRKSEPGATFASYTAAGVVRKDLQDSGFVVERLPGFGRKKHMIRGHRPPNSQESGRESAHLSGVGPASGAGSSTVHIAGAGLAGLATAHAFRRRGYEVHLYDSADRIASGASGNLAGMAAPTLTAEPTSGSLVSLRAQGLFVSWAMDQGDQASKSGNPWHRLGMVRKREQWDRYRRAISSHGLAGVYSRSSTPDSAAETLVGWAGAISPEGLCGHYLQACEGAGFHLHLNHPVDEQRILQSLACGETWILCHAHSLKDIQATRFIPHRPVRGQVVHIPAIPAIPEIPGQAVTVPPGQTGRRFHWPITNQIYAVPAPSKSSTYVLGATFDMHLKETERLPDRDRYLIEELQIKLPDLWDSLSEDLKQSLRNGNTEGRVGFRCQSRDYLPVCGQIPDASDFLEKHGDFYKTAGREKKAMDYVRRSADCRRMPGLFVNSCHGSRGITTSYLGAEIVASLIAGEAIPLERDLLYALDPIRFLWRQVRQPPQNRDSEGN